jgi:hypothetical protein
MRIMPARAADEVKHGDSPSISSTMLRVSRISLSLTAANVPLL